MDSHIQSILDAFEEERGRFDAYKGPLFKAVESAVNSQTGSLLFQVSEETKVIKAPLSPETSEPQGT